MAYLSWLLARFLFIHFPLFLTTRLLLSRETIALIIVRVLKLLKLLRQLEYSFNVFHEQKCLLVHEYLSFLNCSLPVEQNSHRIFLITTEERKSSISPQASFFKRNGARTFSIFWLTSCNFTVVRLQ